MKSYDQVLNLIEALPEEPQESLVEILRKRLASRHRRVALVNSVGEARNEFKAGRLRPTSPAKILRKVLA